MLFDLHAAGVYSKETVQPVRVRQRHRLEHIQHGSDGDDDHRKLRDLHDEIELLLIGTERRHVNEQFRGGMLTDVARRHIERELDLREAALLNPRDDEP